MLPLTANTSPVLLCAQTFPPCLLFFHTSLSSSLAFYLFLLSDSDSNDGEQGKEFSVAINCQRLLSSAHFICCCFVTIMCFTATKRFPFPWIISFFCPDCATLCLGPTSDDCISFGSGLKKDSNTHIVETDDVCFCDALWYSDNLSFGDCRAQPFNVPFSSSSPVHSTDGWVGNRKVQLLKYISLESNFNSISRKNTRTLINSQPACQYFFMSKWASSQIKDRSGSWIFHVYCDAVVNDS